MNKTKIEWADYTWNPVTGCKHGCPYCYAERMSKRFAGDFEPKFHDGRLGDLQKVKKTLSRAKIFVVSMGDLFGEWVPSGWIHEVIEACKKSPIHTYLFLTKNPKRYAEVYRSYLDYRYYMWFGATVTDNDSFHSVGYDLFEATGADEKKRANRFLSIEPLLGEISHQQLEMNVHVFDWVIVGAQTGPGAVKPKPEWVQSIIEQCKAADVPLFLKDNLNWPEKIQEFPEGMEK